MIKIKNESKNAAKLHRKRQFNYKLVDRYHKKFINKKTGSFFTRITKKRKCPACHNSANITIFKKSGSSYVFCKKCTMVYLNPILKQKYLEKYYKNLNTGQGRIVANESKFYHEIYFNGLRNIEKIIKKGKILDIGCSTGFFLDIAKKRGWETYGIEIGKVEAKICKSKNHNIQITTLDKYKTEKKFDAITMWDVFEHIPNGKDALKKMSSLLKPGGVIFLQIPNSGSLAARILREKCRMFDGLEHVNLYNTNSIKNLFDSCCYKIKSICTVISEISVINNFLNFTDPYFGFSQFSAVQGIFGLLKEKTIHEEKLGYKIQIIASKNK